MQLLKIGDRYINADLVIGFDTRGPGDNVLIIFTEATGRDSVVTDFAEVSGDEAAALKRWLETDAKVYDVLNPPSRRPVPQRVSR